MIIIGEKINGAIPATAKAIAAEVIGEIKAQYPSIHVTGAVSNISFNLPPR